MAGVTYIDGGEEGIIPCDSEVLILCLTLHTSGFRWEEKDFRENRAGGAIAFFICNDISFDTSIISKIALNEIQLPK